mmetsp:Transcript_25956/g.58843  ORF Transcript_25956/g.58843 Transcript_25956/m.58843 type:complete len:202 (+) Transcript_25956:54-659(+)
MVLPLQKQLPSGRLHKFATSGPHCCVTLGIDPLEGRILALIADGVELPLCILGHPEIPDILPGRGERIVLAHLCKPSCEPREVGLLVEDLWPIKDPRQHVLHEDACGVPCHICNRDPGPGHVRPDEVVLQPRQLLPELRELGGPCGAIHGPLGAAPLCLVGRQVHGALGMREARLRAIRRGDVEVVQPAEELHTCPLLGRV